MAAPLAALASLVVLLAGPAPADAAGAQAGGTQAPGAAAVVAAAPAFAPTAGHPGNSATPAGGHDHAAFTAPTPTDETGWLLQPAPAAATPVLDLGRPRLVAAAVPEAPHPSLGRRRRADRGARLFDLHLLRMTKDRGS